MIVDDITNYESMLTGDRYYKQDMIDLRSAIVEFSKTINQTDFNDLTKLIRGEKFKGRRKIQRKLKQYLKDSI